MGCSSCGGGGAAVGAAVQNPMLLGRPNGETRAVRVLAEDTGVGAVGATVTVTGDAAQGLIDSGKLEQIGASRSTVRNAVRQDLWYVGPYAFPDENQARQYMQQTGLPMRKVVAGQ